MEFVSAEKEKMIKEMQSQIKEISVKISEILTEISRERKKFFISLVKSDWTLYEFHKPPTGRWEFDGIDKYYLVSQDFKDSSDTTMNQICLNPVESWIEIDGENHFRYFSWLIRKYQQGKFKCPPESGGICENCYAFQCT